MIIAPQNCFIPIDRYDPGTFSGGLTLSRGFPVRLSLVAEFWFLSWDQFFSDPVPTPGGMDLKTLRDAGAYISRLKKSEHESEEWQTAIHCLIQAADHGGPVEFARMGMMQALGRDIERVSDPSRQRTHWGKRKLKRDQ